MRILALLAFLLAGCAHHAPSPASAASHLQGVQSSLSAIDGKTAVIEAWLRTH